MNAYQVNTNFRILKKAMSEIGVKELSGPELNSPEIMKYFEKMGELWVKTDETAWCSAYVNWVCMELGLEFSGRLDAKSWLNVGVFVKPIEAEPGDIVILWREHPDSWKGHVGIFTRYRKLDVGMIGGNQDNQVKDKDYESERIVGVRRMRPAA